MFQAPNQAVEDLWLTSGLIIAAYSVVIQLERRKSTQPGPHLSPRTLNAARKSLDIFVGTPHGNLRKDHFGPLWMQ